MNLDLFYKAKIIQLFKLFSSKYSARRKENGWIRICGSRTRNVSCCLRKSTEGRVTRMFVSRFHTNRAFYFVSQLSHHSLIHYDGAFLRTKYRNVNTSMSNVHTSMLCAIKDV